MGLVGKVQKKLSPEGGRKGGWRKKARAARPPDPGLEPGTCRVLGEGPPLQTLPPTATAKPVANLNSLSNFLSENVIYY